MIDFGYLYRGICGLAHAHPAGTMAGHLGAAVVAGYFFGEDQSELPEGVFRGVEGELKRVIAGEESFWFNAKKTGMTAEKMFAPFPEEPARPESVPSIVAALEQNASSLKQSGHNVIFASLAIRALHDHQEYATPQIVDGVRSLIAKFNGVPPGRGFYGKARGWLSGDKVELPDQAEGFPPYESLQQMIDTTVAELISTAAIRKQGFGGLWHLINHAAAITDLQRFGYGRAARLALPAHRQHVRLLRSLPDVEDELGALKKAAHDPREPVYWEGMLKRDEARLTHRIKTLYGYHTLRRHVSDTAVRRKADDALLYLMA